MAVRQIEPIDRAELRATIQKWIDAHTDVDDTDGVGLLEDVLWEINAQPTLTPPNEALTLEQLREMDGEPVWVHIIDHTIFADKKDDFDGWGMCRKSWVRIWDSKRADIVHIDYDFEDYEKDWIAYRRPPEGEANA